MDSAIGRVPSGFPDWVADFHVYGGFDCRIRTEGASDYGTGEGKCLSDLETFFTKRSKAEQSSKFVTEHADRPAPSLSG